MRREELIGLTGEVEGEDRVLGEGRRHSLGKVMASFVGEMKKVIVERWLEE